MHHAARTELKRLWPQALVATTATVILPVVAVVALTWFGWALPHLLATALGTLAIGIGIAALGAGLWNRRKESVDVAFSDLMLWRFVNRRIVERRAVKNVAEVDLGPDRPKPRRGVIRLEQDRSLEVLHRLTLALEATDRYTLGHSRRVERHVHRTAIAMGLSTDEIRELRIAAALHDVGKICVPEQILRKTGALTPEERSIMREHVSVGAMMVAGAASTEVTEAILHHHEFFDGHGYPSGLSGTGIPLFARVIAVADVWDAITSARPYKGGEARSRASEILRDRAGTQFDPELVDLFLKELPTALPVTSALLIFLTQHRATRPVYEWTHSSAFSDVSRAAAAAGTAAAVITVGAIGPQVLSASGHSQEDAAHRASIELVDLITERQAGLPQLTSLAWEPRARASTLPLISESSEGEGASIDAVLVDPSGSVAPPTDSPQTASPFQVPTADPPVGGAPPIVLDPPPAEVPLDPPAPATPPIDVYVPPPVVTVPPVTPPVDVPPIVELPPVVEPTPETPEEAPEETPQEEAPEDESVPEASPGHDPDGPGNSEDTPAHSDDTTSPVPDETTPIESVPADDLPGNSEDAAGHDPDGPGNSEDAPGHADEPATPPVDEPPVDEAPGNSEDAAGHDPDGPGNSEDAAGHDPDGPGNSEDAPGHADEPATPPVDEAPVDEAPGNSEDAAGHDPDGPGNSEDAAGHDPEGPGNSEDALGHATDLDEGEWVSEGEVWLEESPVTPSDAPGHAFENGQGSLHSSSPWSD